MQLRPNRFSGWPIWPRRNESGVRNSPARTILFLFMMLACFILGALAYRTGAIQAAVNPILHLERATPSPYAKLRQSLFESYPTKANVVVVGDSLSEWFDWQAAFPHLSIASRAIGGENVLGALRRVKSIAATGAKTAILMLGVNDIGLNTPTEVIFADYQQLIESLAAAGMRVIVYQTLTGNPVRKSATGALNAKLRGKCESNSNCEFVELRDLNGSDGLLRTQFTIDGTHLTLDAYAIWRQSVADVLNRVK